MRAGVGGGVAVGALSTSRASRVCTSSTPSVGAGVALGVAPIRIGTRSSVLVSYDRGLLVFGTVPGSRVKHVPRSESTRGSSLFRRLESWGPLLADWLESLPERASSAFLMRPMVIEVWWLKCFEV